MPLPKLILPPDADNYNGKPGNTVESTDLDGGMGRYRSDKLGATWKVPVQWTCGVSAYNYLLAFYRTSTKKGSLPFLIDLVLDSATPAEYTAHFIENSFVAPASQRGLTYVVTAELEVIPIADNPTADAAIISGFHP